MQVLLRTVNHKTIAMWKNKGKDGRNQKAKQKSEADIKNERVLLKSINEQDKDAFGQFYIKYYKSIEVFVFLKLRCIEDAQNITSDAFEEFFKKVADGKQFQTLPNAVAYLYQIAFNLTMKFLRNNRHITSLNEYTIDDVGFYEVGILVYSAEIYPEIHKAMLALSKKEFEILWLNIWQNKTLVEIANDRGISVHSAKKVKSRAVEKLGAILKKALGLSILVKALLSIWEKILDYF